MAASPSVAHIVITVISSEHHHYCPPSSFNQKPPNSKTRYCLAQSLHFVFVQSITLFKNSNVTALGPAPRLRTNTLSFQLCFIKNVKLSAKSFQKHSAMHFKLPPDELMGCRQALYVYTVIMVHCIF